VSYDHKASDLGVENLYASRRNQEPSLPDCVL